MCWLNICLYCSANIFTVTEPLGLWFCPDSPPFSTGSGSGLTAVTVVVRWRSAMPWTRRWTRSWRGTSGCSWWGRRSPSMTAPTRWGNAQENAVNEVHEGNTLVVLLQSVPERFGCCVRLRDSASLRCSFLFPVMSLTCCQFTWWVSTCSSSCFPYFTALCVSLPSDSRWADTFISLWDFSPIWNKIFVYKTKIWFIYFSILHIFVIEDVVVVFEADRVG